MTVPNGIAPPAELRPSPTPPDPEVPERARRRQFNAAYRALRAVLDLSNTDFAEATRAGAEHNRRLLLATTDYERPGAVLRSYVAAGESAGTPSWVGR